MMADQPGWRDAGAFARAAQCLSCDASGQVGSERRRRADRCPRARCCSGMTGQSGGAAPPGWRMGSRPRAQSTSPTSTPAFPATRRRRLSSASMGPCIVKSETTVHPYSIPAEPYKSYRQLAHGNRFQCASSKSQAPAASKLRRKPAHRHPSGAPFFYRKAPRLHPARPARFEFRFPVADSFPQARFQASQRSAFHCRHASFSCCVFARSPCVLHRASPRVSLSGSRSSSCLRTACRLRGRCASPACVGCAFACRPLALVLPASGACPGCARPGSAMCVRVRGAVRRELGLGIGVAATRHDYAKRGSVGENDLLKCAHPPLPLVPRPGE
jgi:hypothetical protein